MKTHKQIAIDFNIEQRSILSLIEKHTDNLKQLGKLNYSNDTYHLNAAQEMFLILNMKNTTAVLELKLDMVKKLSTNEIAIKTKKQPTETSEEDRRIQLKTEHSKLLEEIEKGQQEIYTNFTNYGSRTGIAQVKSQDDHVREHAPF